MAKPKVRTSEEAADPSQVLWALLRPVTHLASLAVGFTALAYGLGWGYLSGYFGQAGAPWVLSMLDTTQVLQISLSNLITFALFAGVMFFLYSEGVLRLKGLATLIGFLVVVLLAGLVLHYGFGKVISARWNSMAIRAFLVSGFILVPIALVTAIAMVVEKRAKTEKIAPVVYGYFVLAIVAFVSPQIGRWMAQDKFSGSDRFEFPTVELAGEGNCNWGLVRAVSSGNFLLTRPDERGKPLFRVVSFEKVTQVSKEIPQSCIANPDVTQQKSALETTEAKAVSPEG